MIGEGESFSPFGRTNETRRYAQTIAAYNPILSIPGKLFAMILLERIRPTFHIHRRSEQAGFTAGRSTTEQFSQFVTSSNNRRNLISLPTLPLSSSKLPLSQCPVIPCGKFFKSVAFHRNFLFCTSIVHRHPQGAAPRFFSVRIVHHRDCREARMWHCISTIYADDIAIFAPSACVLQEALVILQEEANLVGMQISWPKTKLMAITPTLRTIIEDMQQGSTVCRFLHIYWILDYEWWLFLSRHYISHCQGCLCHVSPIKFTLSRTPHQHTNQDQHVSRPGCIRLALWLWSMGHHYFQCIVFVYPCLMNKYIHTYHPRRSPPPRRVRHALSKAAPGCVCSGSRTSASKASLNAPGNQPHHHSYTTTPPTMVRASPPHAILTPCTKTVWDFNPITSMVGKDQEAAPKLDELIQSSTISILLASTPSMLPMVYDRPQWKEGLCLRTASARTRARILSQVKSPFRFQFRTLPGCWGNERLAIRR